MTSLQNSLSVFVQLTQKQTKSSGNNNHENDDRGRGSCLVPEMRKAKISLENLCPSLLLSQDRAAAALALGFSSLFSQISCSQFPTSHKCHHSPWIPLSDASVALCHSECPSGQGSWLWVRPASCKAVNPNGNQPQFNSLEELTLKLKVQYFGHLMRRANSLEKALMLGKIEGKRRTGDRQIDSIPMQWT